MRRTNWLFNFRSLVILIAVRSRLVVVATLAGFWLVSASLVSASFLASLHLGFLVAASLVDESAVLISFKMALPKVEKLELKA